MLATLHLGLRYTHQYTIPGNKTVPNLYPEAPEFQALPAVFATGFMVGLCEWACIKAIAPYLEAPEEQSVGTHIAVSHEAPTPPGLTVTVEVTLIQVQGRQLTFRVEAHDGVDMIARGTHQRHLIQRTRFDQRVAEKTLKLKR